ncbi:DUF3768 domain-containing protein [uncultured Tateyamaria sp.]|uniref:DUF3768 domain-containing protein n=1 Tax=Tateyamaria sp. 1078 TaxID=3417464 RepID=UPI00262566EE|nr:DUF3768 domain-containing protein [uncultured Tateyamaria sp.]
MTSTAAATAEPNTQSIATQDDAFRRLACLGIDPNFAIPGRLVVTPSVIDGGEGFVRAAIAAVGGFENFDAENDPDEHHDFGLVDVRGQNVFWKVDGVDAPSHNGIAMCQTGFVGSQ